MVEKVDSLLEVHQLSKHYTSSNGSSVQAVSDVSFSIAEGEVLGVVGESGCGKSTLARALMRLTEPSSGEVRFAGQNLLQLNRSEMKQIRQRLQIVFQDPFGSLNPRHRVG
nr:ATP-binding cassette domain-containing protein [Granulosicoccus sp.]